jgi:hypothetical protein
MEGIQEGFPQSQEYFKDKESIWAKGNRQKNSMDSIRSRKSRLFRKFFFFTI